MKSKLRLLAFMLCLCMFAPITASANYGKGTFYLNKSSLDLQVGNTWTLDLCNTSTESERFWFISYPCTFRSSNSKVAKVDEYGVVTALEKGTATITVTYDGKDYPCKVKVSASKYQLDKHNITTKTNTKTTLKMTHTKNISAYYYDIFQIKDGIEKTAGYSQIDIDINDKTGTFTVTPLMEGTYRIDFYAYAYETVGGDTKYRDSCTITASIYGLVGDEIGCALGTTRQLKYGGLSDVTFKVKHPSIAKVDENGLLTPVRTGETTLTMTGLNKENKLETYKCSIRITDPETDIDYDYTYVGEKYYPLIEYRSYYEPVQYVSSNEKILSTTGEAPLGVKEGTVKLTAIADGRSFDYTIDVIDPKFSYESTHLTVGSKRKADITGLSSSLLKQKFQYSIKDEAIASVSSNGTITAHKNGFTILTVQIGPLKLEQGICVGTKKALEAVKFAENAIGDIYTETKRMEDGRHDQGSLLWKSYAAAGIQLGNSKIAPDAPALAKWLKNNGKAVAYKNVHPKNLQPGDLIFYSLGADNGQYRNIFDAAIVTGITADYCKDYNFGKDYAYTIHVVGISSFSVKDLKYTESTDSITMIARPTK